MHSAFRNDLVNSVNPKAKTSHPSLKKNGNRSCGRVSLLLFWKPIFVITSIPNRGLISSLFSQLQRKAHRDIKPTKPHSELFYLQSRWRFWEWISEPSNFLTTSRYPLEGPHDLEFCVIFADILWADVIWSQRQLGSWAFCCVHSHVQSTDWNRSRWLSSRSRCTGWVILLVKSQTTHIRQWVGPVSYLSANKWARITEDLPLTIPVGDQ